MWTLEDLHHDMFLTASFKVAAGPAGAELLRHWQSLQASAPDQPGQRGGCQLESMDDPDDRDAPQPRVRLEERGAPFGWQRHNPGRPFRSNYSNST